MPQVTRAIKDLPHEMREGFLMLRREILALRTAMRAGFRDVRADLSSQLRELRSELERYGKRTKGRVYKKVCGKRR